MASKYDEYWINRLDAISSLIEEAQQNGISRRIDVSDITKYGERVSWYGVVVVSESGISRGEMAHARSLGRIVFSNGLVKEGKFRFVISSNLKLRVEMIDKDKADVSTKPTHYQKEELTHKAQPISKPISKVLSQIPMEIWNRIVEKEPEWVQMEKFLKEYGFGRFAVLMLAAGLNDFQLKGKAEVAYWPRIRKILEQHEIPESLEDLENILSKFYRTERLPELKLNRLNRFISSDLARRLWKTTSNEAVRDFLKIWEDLANTMGQSRDAKTITFAMKCLGIALLMAGRADFSFESIPIPVDYRVREFTKRLGIKAGSDEDVRAFWNEVLKDLRRVNPEVNMIHLDSLVWQIGVLSKSEIVNYFAKLGLREVGERIVELVDSENRVAKRRLCVVPCGSLKIWSRYPNAGPTRARDVYIGSFARTCIEYAEKFYPNSYVILSAKHGFLFPDELIPEDYNVTFNDPRTNPISVDELKEQAEKKGLMKYDEIVVVASSNYANIVRKVFKGKKIITPLKGFGGMGPMISAMKRAIIEGKELGVENQDSNRWL